MNRIEAHVTERIKAAKFESEPFPHFMVDNVFPDDFYADLLAHLPRDREYVSPDEYRFGLNLNADGLARLEATRKAFWDELCGWLLAKPFLISIASLAYSHMRIRFFGRENAELKSAASLGRSKSGFVLGPHTDLRHRVLSLVFYLPEDDANWELGTSIYRSRDAEFKCAGGPHYGFENFQKLATMRFIPNTVFGFLKSDHSFHGVEPWTNTNFVRNTLQYEIRDADRSHYYS
jgi:hypothetical protein